MCKLIDCTPPSFSKGAHSTITEFFAEYTNDAMKRDIFYLFPKNESTSLFVLTENRRNPTYVIGIV